jgi:hypothetical protein
MELHSMQILWTISRCYPNVPKNVEHPNKNLGIFSRSFALGLDDCVSSTETKKLSFHHITIHLRVAYHTRNNYFLSNVTTHKSPEEETQMAQ